MFEYGVGKYALSVTQNTGFISCKMHHSLIMAMCWLLVSLNVAAICCGMYRIY
jgi:hypothetical protein